MVGARVKLKNQTAKVAAKARKAGIASLSQAGAYIRGIAKKSIKVSPKPSPPGKQPHSRKGRLKRAILFAVEKPRQSVVIGPTATEAGQIGRTHEQGGTEPPKKRAKGKVKGKARKYPPRPFMGPAFEIARNRLPKLWANSVR